MTQGIPEALRTALINSRKVVCPRCGAGVDEPCKSASGTIINYTVHRQRFAVAVKLRRGGLGSA